MKKEIALFLVILLFIFGCSQADESSTAKTAEERLAEGKYDDTTTDHMVPTDYNSLEQSMDILLKAGNMIGDRHYDELEAAVNSLEREGIDTSGLRKKLSKLQVASRHGQEQPERKIIDLENQFIVIEQSNWQVSPQKYAEIEHKLRELQELDDTRIEKLRERFSKLKVGGIEDGNQAFDSGQNSVNAKESSSSNFTTGLLSPRGCEGNGSFLLGSSPIAMENLQKILPMGMMSSVHITPTDHQYFHTAYNSGPEDDDKNLDRFKIYAPGDGYIVEIGKGIDHRIIIEHSCTFYTIFIHIDRLSDKIKQIVNFKDDTSNEQAWPRIRVKEGEVIGTVGIGKFDFSVIDAEAELKGFVRPQSYKEEAWKIHTVDTFDYFNEPIRNKLLEKNLRKVSPFGGKIDYDIDGRLVGNWFWENTNGYRGLGNENYWVSHLSIVYDALDPDHIVVSVGDFEERGQQFGVKNNAPDPKDIDIKSGMIKYELVPYEYYSGNQKWSGINYIDSIEARNLDETRGTALFEMIDDRRLKAEFFAGKKAAQISSFTDNAKIYER